MLPDQGRATGEASQLAQQPVLLSNLTLDNTNLHVWHRSSVDLNGFPDGVHERKCMALRHSSYLCQVVITAVFRWETLVTCCSSMVSRLYFLSHMNGRGAPGTVVAVSHNLHSVLLALSVAQGQVHFSRVVCRPLHSNCGSYIDLKIDDAPRSEAARFACVQCVCSAQKLQVQDCK